MFDDMEYYTTMKINMFNGINLPSILIQHDTGTLEIVKKFSYTDFIARLS